MYLCTHRNESHSVLKPSWFHNPYENKSKNVSTVRRALQVGKDGVTQGSLSFSYLWWERGSLWSLKH